MGVPPQFCGGTPTSYIVMEAFATGPSPGSCRDITLSRRRHLSTDGAHKLYAFCVAAVLCHDDLGLALVLYLRHDDMHGSRG